MDWAICSERVQGWMWCGDVDVDWPELLRAKCETRSKDCCPINWWQKARQAEVCQTERSLRRYPQALLSLKGTSIIRSRLRAAEFDEVRYRLCSSIPYPASQECIQGQVNEKYAFAAIRNNALQRPWTSATVHNCIPCWLNRSNFDGSCWHLLKWADARRDWLPQLSIPIAWWLFRLRTIESQISKCTWNFLYCVRLNDCFSRSTSKLEPECAQACCSSWPYPNLRSCHDRKVCACRTGRTEVD